MSNKLNLDINMDNLTDQEREILLSLVEKGAKESKRWIPDLHERYFMLDGCLMTLEQTMKNTVFHNILIDTNNCFRTREQAEFEAEKRTVTADLEIYALEHNDPFDWDYTDQWKYFIYLSYSSKHLCIESRTTSQTQGVIYFSSKEIALAAIKSVGEARILKYLFNIDTGNLSE